MATKKKKYKKKKNVNKSRDWLMDYYQTGRAYDQENERRKKEEGFTEQKGLKNLNSFEKTCVVIIALALIGFFVKIVVLGDSITDIGF